MHTNKNYHPSLIVLLLLVSFGSVGAVLIAPALPAIQLFFNRSVGEAQLVITAYLAGYGLGQLPYGPMANGLGRKKTLMIGIIIAIFGSLLCVLSKTTHSFGLLIFGRFVQALGACVGLKISFTMIADCFEQKEATRKVSQLIFAFAIMPGVAMAIGGWLTQMFDWQSCFYFLGLFGVFLFWFSLRLSETAPSIDRRALALSAIIEGYRATLKNRRLILSALMIGCCTVSVYLFASKSPFIGINILGLQPDTFGLYNLIPPIGMFIGSLLATKLAGRFPVMSILCIGSIAALLMTFTMLIPFLLAGPTVLSLFLPMLLIYTAQSTVFANATGYGLSQATNKSNGSALLNFINLAMAVVAVLLSEFIYPDTALLLPIGILFFFILMLFFFWRLKSLDKN